MNLLNTGRCMKDDDLDAAHQAAIMCGPSANWVPV